MRAPRRTLEVQHRAGNAERGVDHEILERQAQDALHRRGHRAEVHRCARRRNIRADVVLSAEERLAVRAVLQAPSTDLIEVTRDPFKQGAP